MTTSRAGDWADRHSRLSRKMRKAERYELHPSSTSRRNVYSTLMIFCVSLGAVFLVHWVIPIWYFAELPYWEQVTLVAVPYFLALYFAWALAISLWLWKNAEKIFVGELDEYPYWPSDSTRSVQTYVWRREDEEGKVEYRAQTFIAIRAGHRLGKHLPGNGPVFPVAARPNDWDKALTKRLNTEPETVRIDLRTHEVLEMPTAEIAKTFEAGYHIGRRYEIPLSVRPRLLGTPKKPESWSGDGVGVFRPWIHRTWPDLRSDCLMFAAWDPLPAAQDMRQIQPSPQATNAEFALADMEGQMNHWRDKFMALMRDTRRERNVLREPGDVIEEMP